MDEDFQVKLAYAGIHITKTAALTPTRGFIVHYEFQWRTGVGMPRTKCMLVAILPCAKTEEDIAEEIYRRVTKIRPILEEKAQSKRRG